MLLLEFEKNGEIITLTENDLFDFRFERGCFSGDTFELGGVNSNLVYCVIDNNTGRFPRGSFANSRLTLYIDGIFCGKYNTELPKRRNGVIEVTAYDDMLKLDCEFPDTVEFPQTFWQVYAYCVQAAGLADNFSFDNCVLNALFNNGVISHEYTEYIYANSCRNLVSGMAEWNGGFAYINDDGKLQVDVFSKDVKKTLYSGDLMAFDYSDETVTFSKIRTSQKNKTYEMGDDSGYTLVIRNQYIGYGLEDEGFEMYFNFLYEYYNGFSLTPMTFTLAEPDLSLKVGDRISVVDEEENVTVTGNISKIVVRGNCSMEITCGGFGNIGSSSNYKPTSLSQTAQAKTEAKVMGGGGVGKASDWDKTSEYFNDYKNNIAGNKNAAGSTYYATAMGMNTKATGGCSTALGCGSEATGALSLAVGQGKAQGYLSIAGGYSTASGDYSVALGSNTQAAAYASEAHGYGTHATGQYSMALGNGSTASGEGAVALGGGKASGKYSVAVAIAGGSSTEASGLNSFASGYFAKAKGARSVAIGDNVTAEHDNSYVIGTNLKSSAIWQTVIGVNNDYENSKNCLFVIGGSRADKGNVFTVDWNGNASCTGNLSCKAVEFEGEDPTRTTAKVVFIDHAPTNADLNGTQRIIVQYDPRVSAKDESTGYAIQTINTTLYKVVNVFAEVSN